MLAEVNWPGVAMGSAVGLVIGLIASLVAGGADAPTGVLAAIQIVVFVISGMVAGRLSLVAGVTAGGFSALLLYFALAVMSVVSGNDLRPVVVVLFSAVALALGSLGGWIVERLRRH